MIGDGFTAEQSTALIADGDVFVTASAGSGKTRVLTGRILRAVLQQNVPLSAIHAVTFTERAASEIRDRVGQGLIAADRPELIEELESAPIGTIHSLCGMYVRLFPTIAGVEPGFRVLDGSQQAVLHEASLRAALRIWTAADPAHPRIRARWTDAHLRSVVVATLDMQRGQPGLSVQFGDDVGVPGDVEAIKNLITTVEHEYSKAKEDVGVLDFDDLQARMLRVLANPDARLEIRARVSRLLVDEFQDTNDTQVQILNAIGSGVTFAVGDEWQSIYRFRRADVQVFRDALDSAANEVIRLKTNFRSHPDLICAVDNIFSRAFGGRYQPVEAGRADSDEEESQSTPGNRINLVLVDTQSSHRPRVEAQLVATQIAELIASGASPGEVAILLPGRRHAAEFERALLSLGVPSLRVASSGYFDHEQVRDVIRLLQWVRNANDARAICAVLSTPRFRVEWSELWELSQSPHGWARALGNSENPAIQHALGLRSRLAELAANGQLIDVVEQAIYSGTVQQARTTAQSDTHVANLRKLIELAASSVSVGVDDLGAFLDASSAAASGAVVGEANIADEATGAVRIMTIHASKGLEFDHVFVCSAGNAGANTYPPVLLDADGEAHCVSPDEWGTMSDPHSQLVAAREREVDARQQEERRLGYVALTRARETLTVTGLVKVAKSGGFTLRGFMSWLLPACGVMPENGVSGLTDVMDGVQVSYCTDAAATRAEHLQQPAASEESVQSGEAPLAAPTRTAAEILAGAGVSQQKQAHPTRSSAEGDVDTEATRQGSDLHSKFQLAITQANSESSFRPGSPLSQLALTLRRVGAHCEVPYVQLSTDGMLERGRFDVLASVPQANQTPWLVELKLHLPQVPDQAWETHEEQLDRYCEALSTSGSSEILVTLASLTQPERVFTWLVTRPSQTAQTMGTRKQVDTPHISGCVPGKSPVHDRSSNVSLHSSLVGE